MFVRNAKLIVAIEPYHLVDSTNGTSIVKFRERARGNNLAVLFKTMKLFADLAISVLSQRRPCLKPQLITIKNLFKSANVVSTYHHPRHLVV